MNIIKGNTAICATAGAVGLTSAYLWWRWYTREVVPTKWKEIGVLSDMMCFPIKSCGPIRMESMECSQMGLKFNYLRDRDFVVVNEASNFQSARAHPRMLLIQPSLDGDNLVLNAPNMETFKIDMSKLPNSPLVGVTLWETPFKSVDCGDEAAKWVSRFILNEESGLRLLHYPAEQNTMKRSRLRELIEDKHSGAYPDITSFNMINESSVDELNTRLTNARVDPQNFRPNFVVKGPLPYEEDNWKWVKIGDVTFKMVKYCTRCVLTTIDYKIGEKNPEGEPLKTLKKYRMIGTKKHDKNSPVLGIHLAVYEQGWVKIGDKIFVS